MRASEEVLLLLQMSHWLMIIQVLCQPNFPEVWPPSPKSDSFSPFFGYYFPFFFHIFLTCLPHTGWRHMWIVPDQNYLFNIWFCSSYEACLIIIVITLSKAVREKFFLTYCVIAVSWKYTAIHSNFTPGWNEEVVFFLLGLKCMSCFK